MAGSAIPRRYGRREDRTRQDGAGKTIGRRQLGPNRGQPVHADRPVRRQKPGRHREPATDRWSAAARRGWIGAPGGPTGRSQRLSPSQHSPNELGRDSERIAKNRPASSQCTRVRDRPVQGRMDHGRSSPRLEIGARAQGFMTTMAAPD
jgi:hypothetical protein